MTNWEQCARCAAHTEHRPVGYVAERGETVSECLVCGFIAGTPERWRLICALGELKLMSGKVCDVDYQR